MEQLKENFCRTGETCLTWLYRRPLHALLYWVECGGLPIYVKQGR